MAEVIAVADWPPFFFSSDMKIRAPFRCVGNFSASASSVLPGTQASNQKSSVGKQPECRVRRLPIEQKPTSSSADATGCGSGSAGLVGTLGGCTCEAPQDRAGSNVPASCAYDAPLFAPVQTDILFVVDDSNSMSEEQEGVARELPTFVEILQTGAGVAQDLRVGLGRIPPSTRPSSATRCCSPSTRRVAGCVRSLARTVGWVVG